jgi:alpha-tubulin suppressor-like RCC1 family protein
MEEASHGGTPNSKKMGATNRSPHDNIGHLKQIAAGRAHILHLTRDGFVFSYGSGEFSAAGHGGAALAYSPQILRPLSDKRILMVSCGEHHSLALTDRHDVYAWGRGFEGQLGLSSTKEIASTPQYVKYFFRNPVVYISCGAYTSYAINHENKLFGWGEGKLGQLGSGKMRLVKTPINIPVCENEDVISQKNVSSISINENSLKKDTDEVRIISVSAGFGHTAALTDEGEIFVWGFNVYGQLGIGDKKTRWFPVRVEKDIVGNILPKIQKIQCSYYATFMIDIFGKIYSWGRGFIGHKGKTDEDLPRKIELNTENRIYTDIYANENTIAFYAPIRVFSISPKCGPALGGTILSIIGTGFIDSEKLRVRFTYGDLS